MDRLKCLEILGLKENPSEDEVKTAYRKLAKQWHPDKNPDDSNAKYKFNEVHQAMKTLLESEEDKVEICAFEKNKEFWEFVMKNYFRSYRYSFCSDEEDLSSEFYSLDSDEDGDFFNKLNEERNFKCFNDWKKEQKAKRKEKLKESAPVRPKQLKKKQQEHLNYQRDRESAKIREDLMNQMEERRRKEEKRLQKDEEKRKEVQEEIKRNLEETMARTNVCPKVKVPKPRVSLQKPTSKAKNRRDMPKAPVHVLSSSSEDNQEVTSCRPDSVDVKNEECWDCEETSDFIINLPTSERVKEERQSKLGDVLRKARGMRCVEEWSVAPEEPPHQQTSSFWDSEDVSSFQCPTLTSVTDKNLHNGNRPTRENFKEECQSDREDVLRKARGMRCVEEWSVAPEETIFWDSEDESSFQCPTLTSVTDKKLHNGHEEWDGSSEGLQRRRISPSFWDREDESIPYSPVRQSFDDNQLSDEERMRYNEIQKLRELEQRRNSRERDEIRAVESFHRRQAAMEKRQMETSQAKDSRFRSRSTSCNESVTSNAWDKKCRAEENADPYWDSCEKKMTNMPAPPSFLQTENVWNKRMAVQNQRQEIVPSTVDDEEAMLQKAIHLSQIQYVEDEKARFKLFEERRKEEETVAIAKSQKPSEMHPCTLSSLDYIPPTRTDFSNIKLNRVSTSSSICVSQEEDLMTSELSSSSDTNNELGVLDDDASTLGKHSAVDESREFSHFSSDGSDEANIEVPQEEETFIHPQVNLNSTKLVKLHPTVNVQQSSRSSEAFVKVSATQNEETSRYLQANSATEDISKLSPSGFPEANVMEYSSGNFQKNGVERSLLHPQTNVNLQRTSSFHVVNSDLEQPEFSHFISDSDEEEESFIHPQVNLNSTKLSSSRVQVNLEQTSSRLHPTVNVRQPSFSSEAFVKKPMSATQNEETSSYHQASSAAEDISKPSLLHPRTNVNLQHTSSFRIVNSDLEKPVNVSRADTTSEIPRPFSKPNETSSHVTQKDSQAVEHHVRSSDTRATMDSKASSPSVINCSVPPFPKSAATLPSVTNVLSTFQNVDTITFQPPVSRSKILENSNSLLGADTWHSQTKLPSVGDTLGPVSAKSDTSMTSSVTDHEEQVGTSILGNSSHPSTFFTTSPTSSPTEFQTVMENQNYFGVFPPGPSAYVPSSSGFPFFPSIPTPSGLANVMPNNLLPSLPFSFPIHPQLGANGFLGHPPQMYASCSPFASDWYTCLPPSYRKLMELPPDTPAMNPFAAPFLPIPNGSNPYAMNNPLPAAFLPMQNCSNPDTPTAAAFPLIQNCSSHNRPAESHATVPGDSDLDGCQQPLNSCGRGRGLTSRSRETKNIGLEQERGKMDRESSLGPPPKDFRLRKRWEKQMEAMAKGLTASNT